MLFLETKPSWRSVALLLLIAPLMYLLILGVPELRLSDEALTAAFTQDMIHSGDFLNTSLYGKQVPGFPLYSWCAAACSLFRMPSAFTFRLPAVLALFGLALVSALFARRIQSPFAGIIAAAIVLSSLCSFRIGSRAQVDIIISLLLTGAWFSLYTLGWGSGKPRWWSAWGISLALVFIASTGVGIKAPIIFYSPLFFLKSRFKSLDEMQAPQHIAVLCIFLALTFIWFCILPGHPYIPWNALAFVKPAEDNGNYFLHFIFLGFKTLTYLFPWVLIGWAPFCLAMKKFEQEKSACSFLRTIVCINLLMFAFIPGSSPLHLMPVFGAMAVLIGVHSEIVLRRHQDFWGRFMISGAWCLFIYSCLALAFWCSATRGWIIIEGFSTLHKKICLFTCLAAFLGLGTQVIFNRGRRSFRSCLMWLIFSADMLFISTYFPCNIPGFRVLPDAWSLPCTWLSQNRKLSGRQLAELGQEPQYSKTAEMGMDIAKNSTLRKLMEEQNADTVYLLLPELQDCGKTLVETFYMRCPVTRIKDANAELPKLDKAVFMLSPFLPAVTEREWTALGPSVPLGGKSSIRLTLQGYNDIWTGDKPLMSLSLEQNPVPQTAKNITELRLYCGILKNKDTKNE